ncbi:hypothetical protein RJG79_08460 [Mycoplasmatota bacterium WC44]
MKKILIIIAILIGIITLGCYGYVFLQRTFGEIIVQESCDFEVVSGEYNLENADAIFIGEVEELTDIKKLGIYKEYHSINDLYFYKLNIVQKLKGEYNESLPFILSVPNERVNLSESFLCDSVIKLEIDTYYLIAAFLSEKENNHNDSDSRTKGIDYYYSFYLVELDFSTDKTFTDQFGSLDDFMLNKN